MHVIRPLTEQEVVIITEVVAVTAMEEGMVTGTVVGDGEVVTVTVTVTVDGDGEEMVVRTIHILYIMHKLVLLFYIFINYVFIINS
jgi:hypothetical protein